uniref:Uncharacterized protein n=1 Tax=Heterorhabditis bacteriophora TaxID=37862 RepID=A0A1I7WG43_HETBA
MNIKMYIKVVLINGKFISKLWDFY